MSAIRVATVLLLVAASGCFETVDECDGSDPALECASVFCPEDPAHPVCDACAADPECLEFVCAGKYHTNPICPDTDGGAGDASMDSGMDPDGGPDADVPDAITPPQDSGMPDADAGCTGLGCACDAEMPCAEGACDDGTCKNCAADGTGCPVEQPFCDTEADACVACLSDTDCTDPALSQCSSTGECTACAESADCGHLSATPVCDTASSRCVECLAAEAGACGSGVCEAGGTSCVACNETSDCASGVCLDGGNSCVECNETSDCASGACLDGGSECVECNVNEDCSLAAPRCSSVTNTCATCTTDNDCMRFGLVCDEGSAQCVQCTVDTEETQCGAAQEKRACNPQEFTCTGAVRGSLGVCSECINDSECVSGALCVPTSFQSAAHGNYCLQQIGAGLCPNQVPARRESQSLGGTQDFYCFPNDTFTTCEGIQDFKVVCDDDDDCGADGLDDGLCRDNACTYGCDSRRDCSGSTDMINKCIGLPSYCDPN